MNSTHPMPEHGWIAIPPPRLIGGDEWRRRLARRRRDSRELTEICIRLDGGPAPLPEPRGRCTNWCTSVERAELMAVWDANGQVCECGAVAS